MRRNASVDILRGAVMVIMALDHVRDYVHAPAIAWQDPMDLATTTPALFFTRWITHFCAPVFVLLAGLSLRLSVDRTGPTPQRQRAIAMRAVRLLVAECTIVALGWSFDITYTYLLLTVIWAIAVAMAVMAVAIRWSDRVLLSVGGAIVVGQDAVGALVPAGGSSAQVLGNVLFHPWAYVVTAQHTVVIAYPVLAWTGVMMLGYVLGRRFTVSAEAARRPALLARLGGGAVLAFVILRGANLYADPRPWVAGDGIVATLMAILHCNKYPPSLAYLLMTLGPAMLVFAWLDGREQRQRLPRAVGVLRMLGTVPMFYYASHIWLAHGVAWGLVALAGAPLASFGDQHQFGGMPAGSGFGLGVVYLVWIGVVLVLVPLCGWWAGRQLSAGRG